MEKTEQKTRAPETCETVDERGRARAYAMAHWNGACEVLERLQEVCVRAGIDPRGGLVVLQIACGRWCSRYAASRESALAAHDDGRALMAAAFDAGAVMDGDAGTPDGF